MVVGVVKTKRNRKIKGNILVKVLAGFQITVLVVVITRRMEVVENLSRREVIRKIYISMLVENRLFSRLRRKQENKKSNSIR